MRQSRPQRRDHRPQADQREDQQCDAESDGGAPAVLAQTWTAVERVDDAAGVRAARRVLVGHDNDRLTGQRAEVGQMHLPRALGVAHRRTAGGLDGKDVLLALHVVDDLGVGDLVDVEQVATLGVAGLLELLVRCAVHDSAVGVVVAGAARLVEQVLVSQSELIEDLLGRVAVAVDQDPAGNRGHDDAAIGRRVSGCRGGRATAPVLDLTTMTTERVEYVLICCGRHRGLSDR